MTTSPTPLSVYQLRIVLCGISLLIRHRAHKSPFPMDEVADIRGICIHSYWTVVVFGRWGVSGSSAAVMFQPDSDTPWQVNRSKALMEPVHFRRHQQLQHLVTRFAFSEIVLT